MWLCVRLYVCYNNSLNKQLPDFLVKNTKQNINTLGPVLLPNLTMVTKAVIFKYFAICVIYRDLIILYLFLVNYPILAEAL